MSSTAGLVDDQGKPANYIAPGNPAWFLVWRAGVYHIGRQCDQYIDALFRFNRDQRGARQGLSAIGAATAGIMGLAGLGAEGIAITASAFGLGASLFDAGVNSVLFTIEPSALRNVAQQGMKIYISSIDEAQIRSRPDVLIALQGYLTQCSPATIEANINNAASGAPSVVSPFPATAANSAQLAAPGSTLLAVPTGRSVVIPVSQPQSPSISGARSAAEKALKPIEGRWIEAALCLLPDPQDKPVVFGDDVRNAIQLFRTTPSNQNGLGKDIGLTRSEAALLAANGKDGGCDRNVYANAFEAFAYPKKDDISTLQRSIAARLPAGAQIAADGTFGPPTRDAIKAIQKQYCRAPTGAVTRPFIDGLVDEPPKDCPKAP